MFIYIFALYISKISNSISAFLHINLNHHQIIENKILLSNQFYLIFFIS